MSEDADSTYGRLFASGSIIFAGLLINFGLGFITRILIGRLLGPDLYGEVVLGFAVLTLSTIFVIAGIDIGVGRYLPRSDDPEYKRGVLVSAYHIVVPLSLLCAGIVAFLAEPIARYAFHSPQITVIIQIFALTIPFSVFIRLTVGTTKGLEQPQYQAIIRSITLPVSKLVFAVAAILLGFKAVGVTWAWAGAYAGTAVLAIYYLVRHTTLFERSPSRTMRRELLVFSLPMMITVSMYKVFHDADTFILGFFFSTDLVATYDTAYRLPSFLKITLTAFSFLFLPVISRFHTNGETSEMGQTYRTVTKWIFVVTLPIALVFISYPTVVIEYTFGPEYVAGSTALTILAIGYLVHAVFGLSGEVLTAVGKSKLMMYDSLAVVGVNLLLNIYLIPSYGMVGAAIATLVGYIVMDTLYLGQVYRIVGIHPFSKAMVRPGVIAIGLWTVSYGILRITDLITLPTVIGMTTVFSVVYLVVLLRFGAIEDEEASLVRTFEERIGVDLDPLRSVAKRISG